VTHHETDKMWEYLLRIDAASMLRGPFSTEDMGDMFSKGIINEKTLVRQLSWSPKSLRYEEDSTWKAAVDFSELSLYVSKKAPNTYKISHIIAGAIAIIVLFVFVICTLIYSSSSKNTLNSERKPPFTVAIDKTDQIKPPNGAAIPIEIATSIPVTAVVSQRQQPSSTSTIPGIIKETNRVRQENGLPLLTENSLLDRVAEERVEDMLQKQYVGHISPSGQGATEITQRVGYHYKILAENIAAISMYTNDRKFIDGWMQSPGHRQNIMNDEVRDIGVAVKKGFLKGQEQWVAVQIFGLQSLPVTHETKRNAAVSQPLRTPNKAESSLIFRVVK